MSTTSVFFFLLLLATAKKVMLSYVKPLETQLHACFQHMHTIGVGILSPVKPSEHRQFSKQFVAVALVISYYLQIFQSFLLDN